jgi:dihydropteroate synthase
MKLVARDATIDVAEPILMGILNVTPDSFSGDGIMDVALAVTRGTDMVANGATIVDIGGESSRPGSVSVTATEELQRVVPIISGMARHGRAVISVDTAKSVVAERALEAGAHIINDITGLEDAGMAEVVARYGAGVVIMHMKGMPQTMQRSPKYVDVAQEVAAFFEARISRAVAAGIGRDHIVLDPGIGFGKNLDHNMALLGAIPFFVEQFGLPLLIGASRKTFLGTLTGRSDPSERLFATVAVTALAVRDGARIVRVHDVAANRDAVMIARALSEATS